MKRHMTESEPESDAVIDSGVAEILDVLKSKPVDPVKDKWFNPQIISTIKTALPREAKKQRMELSIYSRETLTIALVDVLGDLGWITDNQETSCKNYQYVIRDIINGKTSIGSLTTDKFSKNKNVLLIRVYIHVGDQNGFFKYNDSYKKDVLMSNEFYKYLSDYCSDVLDPDIAMYIYSGLSKPGSKSFLSFDRVPKREKGMLNGLYGDTDPSNYVMVMFKKYGV